MYFLLGSILYAQVHTDFKVKNFPGRSKTDFSKALSAFKEGEKVQAFVYFQGGPLQEFRGFFHMAARGDDSKYLPERDRSACRPGAQRR